MKKIIHITDPEFLKIPIVFLELELDQWVNLSDSEIEILLDSYNNLN